MFSKEKGKTWKITNGLLLITLIAYVISLLTTIISELLPENGDYSNFIFTEFSHELLNNLSVIAIIGFTLYLINNKYNLFDKSYPFSRKFFNFSYIFVVISSAIYFITCIFNLLYDAGQSEYRILELKDITATFFVYLLALILVNKKPIMIKDNSQAQNFFNYISISACVAALYSFVLTFLNINTFDHPIDFLRTIIIEIIIFGIFAFVIYWINYKKKNNNIEIPETNDK